MSGDTNVNYPIPIYRVAHRYYLYDAEHVAHLRREHNILGVLVGTLPQSPQQNVFLGLPQQLLAEEARLLVEQGHAYIVDDVDAHRNGLRNLSAKDRSEFQGTLTEQGLNLQKAAAEQARAKKELALSKLPEAKQKAARASLEDKNKVTREPEGDEGAVFDSSPSIQGSEQTFSPKAFPITPTTSHPPLAVPQNLGSISADGESPPLPDVPSLASYAFYRHLHSQSYFMSSGLRFGAQYSVYPGDPLRFHAHFLARGYEWEEEIDLLSVIGGGRLGTGVKKGFLIGGAMPPERPGKSSELDGPEPDQANGDVDGPCVRCFCIEWAGM